MNIICKDKEKYLGFSSLEAGKDTSEMAIEASSSKRKASALVPDSVTSYLMGALHENFEHLKAHIQQDCAFVKPKVDSKRYIKQILEELFRYLYLLADSSSDGVIRSSPSYFVDQAFHCLMLDPVLYFNICDEMLNLLGKDADTVKMRVLPHDALGGKGDDEGHRRTRYTNTLAQYKASFGEDPPLNLWSDYSNDPVAVQAELEAQEAQITASVPKPELVATPTTPLNSEVVQPSADASALLKSMGSQKSGVKLRFNGTTGNGLGMSVKWSDRFGTVLDRVCTHQQRPTKHVVLTCRGMVLRNYMTPYNLNMKDGDVIECNIPIYSPEEIAANKNDASTIAAASSASTTATATTTAPTSAITTTITSTSASSTSASVGAAVAIASASTAAAITLVNSPTTSGTPAVLTTVNAVSLGTHHSTSTASLGNNLASTAVPIVSDADTVALVAMPTTSPPSTDHTSTITASSTITFLVRDSRDIAPVLSYTMKRTEPMRSVFRAFSHHSGIEEEKLRLLLTRSYFRVNDFDTPKMLEMNEGEELLVMYQQLGC